MEKIIYNLLLEQAISSVAKKCLHLIRDGEAQLTHGEYPPASTQHIRRIYAIRADINEEARGTSGYVEGYEELLSTLKLYNDATLRIFTYETSSKYFWVLTNSETTALIGVLLFPPRGTNSS